MNAECIADPATNDYIAGVDEAGRGPLAGPVVAAAVILDKAKPIVGLRDSKKLSHQTRLRLAGLIRLNAHAWSIAKAGVAEIEQLNILQASLLAMKRAIEGLSIVPAQVLIDGLHCPAVNIKTTALKKGDDYIDAISAASILAKVSRDEEMLEWDRHYPGYGFAQHKGYPTPSHIAALKQYGITEIHRRTFSPVKQFL